MLYGGPVLYPPQPMMAPPPPMYGATSTTSPTSPSAATNTVGPLELELSMAQIKELTLQIKAFIRKEQQSLQRTKQARAAAGSGAAAGGVNLASMNLFANKQMRETAPSGWVRSYKTDAALHGHDPIHAMVIMPDDSGSAGTLISTSSGYINCWRWNQGKITRAKRKTTTNPESFLQHVDAKKNTGYRLYSLCHVPATRMLICAGMEINTRAPALLSIHIDKDGILSAPKDVRVPPAVSLKVESLTSLVSLSSCIATSVQGSITVFDMSKGDFSAQKTTWTAHKDFITALRSSANSNELISGSLGGEIHVWDMRSPPQVPRAVMRYHTNLVTDLQVTGNFQLWSSSVDTTMLQWDLRNTVVPLNRFIPDTRSVLSMRPLPELSAMAIGTLKGMYYMTTNDFTLNGISSDYEDNAFPVLEWSSLHGVLYGCKLSGEIEAWQRPPQT